MEKIATDTYSFERLRTEGCVYVDKTSILKRLADGSVGTLFFVGAAFDTEMRNLSDRAIEVAECN